MAARAGPSPVLSRRELLRAGRSAAWWSRARGVRRLLGRRRSPPKADGAPASDRAGLLRRGPGRRRPGRDRHRGRAVLALGGGLYGQLVGQAATSAISPYSAAVALGMTVNGAVGATRDEMLEVLAADGHRRPRRRAQRAHGVRRVAGRPRARTKVARSRSPQPTSCSGRPTTPGSSLPRRAGPQLRRRPPRGRLPGRPRRPASRSTAGPPSRPTTGSPRPSPRRVDAADPAGAGQRSLLQGALADAVRGRATTDDDFHLGDGATGGADHARHRGYGRGRRLARGSPALRRRHPGDDGGAARRGPRGRPRRPGRGGGTRRSWPRQAGGPAVPAQVDVPGPGAAQGRPGWLGDGGSVRRPSRRTSRR